MKPILTDSRTQLLRRIETHSSLIIKEHVDPAAHLDLRSYNLYGDVGYSLGMSAIPLDSAPNLPIENNEGSPSLLTKGEQILRHSRYLYSQYLSSRETNLNCSNSSSVTITDIEHILDRYKEALDELKREGDGENGRSLQLQAMHELGNILYYLNDKK